MMQSTSQGLTMDQVAGYAKIEVAKLAPKDRANLQRSDLKKLV